MLIDPKELVDRYVAVWNQPDAERRRKAITQLWTEDGVQHSNRRRRCARPPRGWASPQPSRPAATTSWGSG